MDTNSSGTNSAIITFVSLLRGSTLERKEFAPLGANSFLSRIDPGANSFLSRVDPLRSETKVIMAELVPLQFVSCFKSRSLLSWDPLIERTILIPGWCLPLKNGEKQCGVSKFHDIVSASDMKG